MEDPVARFRRTLEEHIPFLRAASPTDRENDIRTFLRITDGAAIRQIATIIGAPNFSKESAVTAITALYANGFNWSAEHRADPTPDVLVSQGTNQYAVKIVFKTKEGYYQFTVQQKRILSWGVNHDLINCGLLNALNDQQQRKSQAKVPMFSKIVVREERRRDRELLLSDDFVAHILPDDVEIRYFVNQNQVDEANFPLVKHIQSNTSITAVLEETVGSNYFRARTHNFVRFLALHASILHVVPPLDREAVVQALKDLEVKKKMIGISKLVKTMEKDFQLFSHPTGSPRGVLFWGPPGTGKTYVISTLLTYLGVPSVAPPMAAGDFLKGIVGESELMINELSKRAKAVPWMLTGVSIDEIDGLAPSRQGAGASGGKIDMISVLLSIIGGNKDTPNLVLFGATNRYESMDEAFLRRMNIKLFVGRPSAEARKQWVEENLIKKMDWPFTEQQKNEYLPQVSKLTVNFSNDAMRVFINFMDILREEFSQGTGKKFDEFQAETVQNILSVCIAERIVIADSYLPNWIEEWHKYDRIRNERCPEFRIFESFAKPNLLRQKYFKVLPRIFIDINAQSHQIQLKVSREASVARLLASVERQDLADIASNWANFRDLAEVGGFSEVFEDIEREYQEFMRMVKTASGMLINEGRLREYSEYFALCSNMGPQEQMLKNWYAIAKNDKDFKNSTSLTVNDVIRIGKLSNEVKALRGSIVNYAERAKEAFKLESKIQTVSIEKHMDAAEFDYKEALYLLFQFVVKGDMGCFHYIDASSLYRKGITDEVAAIRYIAAAVEEASQYASAMVAIDLDSLSEVNKEVTGLKKEMKTPHAESAGGSFGPTISYRPQRVGLMNMVIELAKSNTPVWIAIISKHPFLTNKFKETLEWWTLDERKEQERSMKHEQDLTVDKVCKRCHEHYTEAENKFTSCGEHQSPDRLFIDDYFESGKILKAFTKVEAEAKIELDNIPRSKVHYFCCGRCIDDKGEKLCKHEPGINPEPAAKK